MPVDLSDLYDTLTHDGDIPTPRRGRGRPPGSKNKPRLLPDQIGGVAGPRERAPSQVPFEVYNVPDPLAMVQALYAEVAWRIDTLRNVRKMGGGVGNRQGKGVEANEAAVPILIDTVNTLVKTLQSHDKALLLAKKLSESKTPAQMLEHAIQKVMGQDLATQRGIIRRLRENLARLAPITQSDKAQLGEVGGFGKAVGAIESLVDDMED